MKIKKGVEEEEIGILYSEKMCYGIKIGCVFLVHST